MSAVWAHYEISEKDSRKAVCKACNADISRGGASKKTFSTSGLIHHLKAKHPERHAEFLAHKSREPPSSSTSSGTLKRCSRSAGSPTWQQMEIVSRASEKQASMMAAVGGTPEAFMPAEAVALADRAWPVINGVEGGVQSDPDGPGMSILYVNVKEENVDLLQSPAEPIASCDPEEQVDEKKRTAGSYTDTDPQQEPQHRPSPVATPPRASGTEQAEADDVSSLYKRRLELDCAKKELEIKKLKLEIEKLQSEKQEREKQIKEK